MIYITATNISALHQYLDNSHHEPLCVLHQTGSPLERQVRKLWLAGDDSTLTGHLGSWLLAVLNTTQITKWPGYLLKESHPPSSSFLRCFLGPVLSHDFEAKGSFTTKSLQQWFHQLGVQYNQLVNSSVEMIEASVAAHRFTLVVFPTAHQHEQLEHAVFQMTESLSAESSVSVIVIHSSSVHAKDIKERYKVFNVPSVLVIEKEGGGERRERLFNIHDVVTGQMETELRAHLVPASQLTASDFERNVVKVRQGEHYSPFLVGFYAHWEKDTSVFLSFLRHTVLEFKSLGADLRFGVVDSARNNEVVSLYMSPECLHHLPFLAVFYAEEGRMTVNQTELLVKRPSPYTVYSALREAGLTLTDSQLQPMKYQPYGQDTRVCLREEGPGGNRCSPDNTTLSSDVEWNINSLITEDSTTGGKDAKNVNGFLLTTSDDWQTMGENPGGDGNDLSVFITIFIFIRHMCKSCEENQPRFQYIAQQLSANDTYKVRLVNCSLNPGPCQHHHVTGFPTVVAFRHHNTPARCGASATATATDTDTTCLGKESQHCEQPSVRLEYHGVMTKAALMAWIKQVSVSPVQPLHFSKPDWGQRESVQLLATVVPVDSEFLPLPPHKNKDYFYSADCFREVCERLFGLAACFTVNSADIPPSQFDNDTADLAVTQVDFRRRDGVGVTLMRLGLSLSDLVDQETDHALHMFHTHHSYGLARRQKCEEDHGRCTVFLESFARDHLRLPVTSLTSDILHSHNEFLFGAKPVLLALVEAADDGEFLKTLHNVAYTLYKDVVVVTLDVGTYPAWAGSFVPRDYHRLHAESHSRGEMSVYPRLCLFYWNDHTKAAFYPPYMEAVDSGTSGLLMEEDLIAGFVRKFLQDPVGNLIETERL
ncbi:hypothetical protein ACOMHN_065090 [Nucella lapillus]